MAAMRSYVLLIAAVVLLSFAAQGDARELKQATCPAALAKGLTAKASTATFKSGLAADCPLSKFLQRLLLLLQLLLLIASSVHLCIHFLDCMLCASYIPTTGRQI